MTQLVIEQSGKDRSHQVKKLLIICEMDHSAHIQSCQSLYCPLILIKLLFLPEDSAVSDDWQASGSSIQYPVNRQRLNDVITKSLQRHDIAVTLLRCCGDVLCVLGKG